MPHSAEDVNTLLDRLIDEYGDHKIVDEDGNEVTFVGYQATGQFVIKTEDN